MFSNDSKRLILGTSFGGTIAVVELPIGGRGAEEEGFQVVGVFSEHSRSEGGREIRGKHGKDANGDVEMDGEDDEEEETPSTGYGTRADKPATVVCLAVSGDGKWLASADLERKVCIFDLEKLSVRLHRASSFELMHLSALHYAADALAYPCCPRISPYLDG